jgi:hypothetical protein
MERLERAALFHGRFYTATLNTADTARIELTNTEPVLYSTVWHFQEGLFLPAF